MFALRGGSQNRISHVKVVIFFLYLLPYLGINLVHSKRNLIRKERRLRFGNFFFIYDTKIYFLFSDENKSKHFTYKYSSKIKMSFKQ